MPLPAGEPATAAAACRLPVSGLAVEIARPTGRDELLLLEMPDAGTAVALALAQRLGRIAEGTAVAWRELPVPDLDAFVLRLRQALIGDRITADVRCRAPNCGSRIDIAFSIAAYLGHHRPRSSPVRRRSWSLTPRDDEPGWYRLTVRSSPEGQPATELQFRLPTVGDQLAVANMPNGDQELARRCIRPAEPPRRLRRLVEAAMEAIAPSLAGNLEGVCPDCGARVALYFDARQFCLQELRNRAVFLYEDIDVLAQRYCWSERAILALPNTRRASYAELARQHGSA